MSLDRQHSICTQYFAAFSQWKKQNTFKMECLKNSALIWKVLTRIEQYNRPVNLTDYSSFENILQTFRRKSD